MSYPRIASYGGYKSNGFPLVVDGQLSQERIDLLCRYPVVVLHANMLMLRPDVTYALRRANPEIRIYPYVTMTHWWLKRDFKVADGDTSLNAMLHAAYQRCDAFMPEPAVEGYEIDWSRPNMGREVGTLLASIAGSGLYDGMFLDYLSPNAYMEVDRRVRAQAEMTEAIRLIEAAGGITSFRLIGNGIGAEQLVPTTLSEGFPEPLTSLKDVLNGGSPYMWLKSENESLRAGRYVTAVACLVGATSTWGPQRPESFDGNRWLPEWSVTPSGSYDPSGHFVGWLGDPLGPAYPVDSDGLVLRRFFQNGCVLVNSSMTVQTVDMIVPGHKHIGAVAPVRKLIIGPQDAVFLVRVERPM